MDINKLLIFDLKGRYAHFRKFYTSSSSLSYTFPPRTTIAGLIAGIVGIPSERFSKTETYYEIFSSKYCKIAISVKTPLRKIVQTVNYIQTKKEKWGKEHTQIPIEIILPARGDFLKYRVYFYHSDREIFSEIFRAISQKKWVFPPYMGITEFIAEIEFVDLIEDGQKMERVEDEAVVVNSVVNTSLIINGPKLDRQENKLRYIRYIIEEKVPLEFNSNRENPKIANFIYGESCGVDIKKCKRAYNITYKNEFETITFMEDE